MKAWRWDMSGSGCCGAFIVIGVILLLLLLTLSQEFVKLGAVSSHFQTIGELMRTARFGQPCGHDSDFEYGRPDVFFLIIERILSLAGFGLGWPEQQCPSWQALVYVRNVDLEHRSI